MITYENAVFEAQFALYFILEYSVFYILNHSMNFESCDIMIVISTRARVHFFMHLLNCKPFGHET